MNPFTKTFKNIASIWVGDCGFFTLLKKLSSIKYEWVVLKHIYKQMQSMHYICSSLDRVWRKP
jgi:hypothetical protein